MGGRRRGATLGNERLHYITGSVDVETCVIMKTRFRTPEPLLVDSASIEARFTSNKNGGKG